MVFGFRIIGLFFNFFVFRDSLSCREIGYVINSIYWERSLYFLNFFLGYYVYGDRKKRKVDKVGDVLFDRLL